MAQNDRQPPILIVGAGPTGLLLALWLAQFSVSYRLIERVSSPGHSSRAIAVHARTLEFYRQLHIADDVIAQGLKIERFVVNHIRMKRGEVRIADNGKGLSKFPFVLTIPQHDHEALLERTLNQRGGKVERGVEAVALAQKDCGDKQFVEVTLREVNSGKEEIFLASYVAGCDGAHSVVRAAAGIKMEGGTYDRRFFVCDVQGTGSILTARAKEQDKDTDDRVTDMNICLSNEDFCIVIPLYGHKARARIIGFIPESLQDSENVNFDDVLPTIKRNVPFEVENVDWFAPYRAHHRAAAHFRQGRIFLLGDAAHLHSPVGGQGMNTGLGDATNLAWKVAAVWSGSAPPELLETYEEERMAFAVKLVNTTDYFFTLVTGEDFRGRLVRNWALPYIMPFVISLLSLGPMIFKKTSQIEIEYCASQLSQNGKGTPGSAIAGRRLPWVEHPGEHDQGPDNHTSLDAKVWQAHVYGTISAPVKFKLQEEKIPLTIYSWSSQAERVGLARDVLYLIRPDGYIGLTMTMDTQTQGKFIEQDVLDKYLNKWGFGASKTLA